MATIPPYDWPAPDPLDTPDVPADVMALGTAIAADLQSIETDHEDRLNELESLGLNGNEVRTLGHFSGGASTNVTTIFSGITQQYTHLQMLWRGGSNTSNVLTTLSMRFNLNGGDNYRGYRGFTFDEEWDIQANQTSGTAGWAGVVGASGLSFGTLWIPFYSTAGANKSVKGDCVARGIGGNLLNQAFGFGITIWTSTSPVTSIQLWPASQLWNSSGVAATLIGYK